MRTRSCTRRGGGESSGRPVAACERSASVTTMPIRSRRALSRDDARRAPVVVADGFCPACGRAAPVPAYLDLLKSSRGWLVIDDTQALGILGHSPGPQAPLGRGGGGTLRWYGAPAERVVTISSLAKGFGVPVAMLGGPRDFVERFNRLSKTRVHCSGISWVELHAAEASGRIQRAVGRSHPGLPGAVDSQAAAEAGGLEDPAHPGGCSRRSRWRDFRDLPAAEIQRRLESAEVQTVLQRDRGTGEAACRHSADGPAHTEGCRPAGGVRCWPRRQGVTPWRMRNFSSRPGHSSMAEEQEARWPRSGIRPGRRSVAASLARAADRPGGEP